MIRNDYIFRREELYRRSYNALFSIEREMAGIILSKIYWRVEFLESIPWFIKLIL